MESGDPAIADHDEHDDSSEDEDFNPATTDAAEDDNVSDSSSDDDDTPKPSSSSRPKKGTNKKRKKAGADLEEEELDSGDEATIRELRKRKKRKGGDEDDSGGEGGLIKTRAQRRAEKQEKAELQRADKGQVTVDVDSLWARLTAIPVGRQQLEPLLQQDTETPITADTDSVHDRPTPTTADDDGMVTIKRSYGFAGETHTEEKRVHKDSAEAKLYFASLDPSKKDTSVNATSKDDSANPPTGPQLRRPLRRASRFEPNPTGEVKALPLERQRLRAPSRADVTALQLRKEEEDRRKGRVQKLNTVQKSAIDWAAHVDREGLKEELDIYGRSKKGFLGRMDFLRGVEGRKEMEERNARMVTQAANAAAAATS